MKRRTTVFLVIGIAILLLISGYAWVGYVGHTYRNKYGPNPGLGGGLVPEDVRGMRYCFEVTDITPKAHYNWLGQMWQEKYILWQDVQVLVGGTDELAHGKTGPVEPGDVVCSWPAGSSVLFVYKPTGKPLHET